jgi:hypothetical protein
MSMLRYILMAPRYRVVEARGLSVTCPQEHGVGSPLHSRRSEQTERAIILAGALKKHYTTLLLGGLTSAVSSKPHPLTASHLHLRHASQAARAAVRNTSHQAGKVTPRHQTERRRAFPPQYKQSDTVKTLATPIRAIQWRGTRTGDDGEHGHASARLQTRKFERGIWHLKSSMAALKSLRNGASGCSFWPHWTEEDTVVKRLIEAWLSSQNEDDLVRPPICAWTRLRELVPCPQRPGGLDRNADRF